MHGVNSAGGRRAGLAAAGCDQTCEGDDTDLPQVLGGCHKRHLKGFYSSGGSPRRMARIFKAAARLNIITAALMSEISAPVAIAAPMAPIPRPPAATRPIFAANPNQHSRKAPMASSISSTTCNIHSMSRESRLAPALPAVSGITPCYGAWGCVGLKVHAANSRPESEGWFGQNDNSHESRQLLCEPG